jgi:hypothetical protein
MAEDKMKKQLVNLIMDNVETSSESESESEDEESTTSDIE